MAAYLREPPAAGRGVTKALNAQRIVHSFYADPAIVRRFRAELVGSSVGKSCVRFRRLDAALLGLLGRIAGAYGK